METGREEALRGRAAMRRLNERAISEFDSPDLEIELSCECGEVSCFEVVSVTRSDYAELAASGRFLLVPGHTTPDAAPAGLNKPKAFPV
jgi:hypothetical protein